MERKSLIGVTLCGIFSIFMSIFSIYAFFKMLRGYKLIIEMNFMPNWMVYYGIAILPIVAVLLMISGIGILKNKSWGRKILLYISIYNLLAKIILLCLGITQKTPAGKPLGLAISFGVYLLIIYYFTRPKVKEQFK
ncbi:MAG: hypothetical protein MUC39_05205 [Candidatus Omnitrophica bacterium]|jgi:hypothetical protein|nr:hypothetical protein [Candidatus Omnitrophota bacterium]